MDITDLITRGRIVCDSEVASKKRVIEVLSELLATGQPDLTARPIFDSLVGRERLGSTGLGHGVALPHGRFSQSQHAVGAFVKLRKGVDFDALDRQPVDLVFGLLVPDHYTDEHLKILAYLAEMFSDRAFCQQLRETDSDQLLFERLMDWKPTISPLP
ncbi:MAG: PTS sugar transporter subunit IIA [Candidatus Competibacter sp.]|nr:PTS sugar transporter subunit IIA [Candidatus Competibacter sp.]MDS4069016.1 PTS sugar transporter subunit IIA [Candidatus Competibacter sp.]